MKRLALIASFGALVALPALAPADSTQTPAEKVTPLLQSLEQLRGGIAQRVRQQKLVDRVEALRRAAKVDFDPKFFRSMPVTKKPS